MKKIDAIKYLVILMFSVNIWAPTQAQNFKVIDINNTKNSSPGNNGDESFAVLKGIFYFSADDGIHGRELYKSDGTAEGTQLVKDINAGAASSDINGITVSGNKFYFNIIDNPGNNSKL